MIYIVTYLNKKSQFVEAKNLDEAEKLANKLGKDWIDIKIKDFKPEIIKK